MEIKQLLSSRWEKWMFQETVPRCGVLLGEAQVEDEPSSFGGNREGRKRKGDQSGIFPEAWNLSLTTV